MLINKYNVWRRFIYRVYGYFPSVRLLKRLELPLKIYKLRKVNAIRMLQLEGFRRSTGRHPLFSHVEIETINRCNGECGFCPVNRHIDPRPAARMSPELFRSIIDQLRELDFRGAVCPFSNNEPLLDTRIFDFLSYIRERLPKARICMYTNGLLLTVDKYRQLLPLVDELNIDDYGDDFTLHPNIREIYDISKNDPAANRKTRIMIRYRNEIMTSRGGESPNKKDILPPTLPVGCLLPARQVIVRPDGKLSLCCNDALGKMTLGDLTKDRLEDIWFGPRYSEIRRKVLESRSTLDICRHCDTMHF